MHKLIALLTAVLILGAVNYQIYASERLLRDGRVFYLKLAPVDPRSLMQGDYMALNYEVGNELRMTEPPSEGWVVLTIGTDEVAGQPRIMSESLPLKANEVRLRYRRDGWQIAIGSDAYFFEEGQADRYSKAAYGIYRTDDSGRALLTGLATAAFEPL